MSDATPSDRIDIEGSGLRSRLGRRLFGDRLGLLVFLASVCLFSVYWIAAWRITDSLTFLNALHALTEGSLAITEPAYGTSIETPGVTAVDGTLYGRNYGVVVVSLVPLAFFRILGAVADLRLAVAGLWVLGLLATVVVVGRIVDRRRAAVLWGSVGALVLFGVNVAVATDLDPGRAELYALQTTHLIVAAIAVLILYRLLSRMHGRRAGLFGAVLLSLGTPLGMWATIPKRHVITAAVFLTVAYALYRSREGGVAGTRSEVLYRAVAYVSVGLFAWVHAPEALMLFVTLVLVDVPTAARRDVRALTGIGAAFLLSLGPFFLTNYLAFGSPFTPPRVAGGFPADPGLDVTSSGGGGGSGGGDTTDRLPLVGGLIGTLGQAATPLVQLSSLVLTGVTRIVTDPGHLLDVFVRSGALESGWAAEQADHEAVNLTVLESAPIVAGLTGVVAASVGILRRGKPNPDSRSLTPERQIDALVVLFGLLMTLAYLDRLPLHAQVTMRYLVPLLPAYVYGLVRLQAVRCIARNHWRPFAWTVAAGVLVGGQLVVAVLAILVLGRGEAFQFHALLGLATAAPVAVWGLLATREARWGRLGAVAFGLAVAATTVLLFAFSLEYWEVAGEPGLPLVRTLAEVVALS